MVVIVVVVVVAVLALVGNRIEPMDPYSNLNINVADRLGEQQAA